MGYESEMILVNIKIKTDSLQDVKRALDKKKVRGFSSINWYFEFLMLDEENFLCFKARGDDSDIYIPCDDGSVPAIIGKWYDGEDFASWLKQYSEEDGRIVFHSVEGDGETWGWEFNGNGRMRDLALCSIGKWR